MKTGWWQHGWIPLDADGGGNGSVVDTDPGENGTVGQVLFMDHETGPSGPNSSSIVGYLEDIVQDVDAGRVAWDGRSWVYV